MITLQKNPNSNFKLLNLTDIQACANELNGNNEKSTAIIIGTIRELIERVKPDLITLSGDQSWCGDVEANRILACLLDEYKIPYACAWGNHDQDGGIDKLDTVIAEYEAHPLFVYENGPCELGRGNYVIKICEGEKIVSAIIIMDTHDREPYIENGEARIVWSRLTPAQHKWYAEQIRALTELGCTDAMILTHIPIYAYRDAFKAAFVGGDERSFSSEDSERGLCWRDGYKSSFGVKYDEICSHPEDDGFFEMIKELGLVKNYLCGHDHTSSYSIEYQGVRLTYGLKTGPGCYWNPKLNGGTVITITDRGVSEIHHEYVDQSKFIQGE